MPLWTTIFRKDFRQLRVMLAIFYGLLLLQIPIRLGLVGSFAPDPSQNAWRPILLEGMFSLVAFVIAAKFVCLTVYQDSPARRERILATRPVTGRALFAAKALAILLFVVLPHVVATVVYLALSGLPSGFVLTGAVESLLLSLVLCAAAAAFSLLWESLPRFYVGAGVAAASALILPFLIEAREYLPAGLRLRPDSLPHAPILFALLCLAAAGFAALAALHLRRPWPLWRRLAVLPLIAVLTVLLTPAVSRSIENRNSLAITPTEPAVLVKRVVNRNMVNGRAEITVALSPAPAVAPDPALDVCWHLRSFAVGDRTHSLNRAPDPRTHPAQVIPRREITPALHYALRKHFPEDYGLVTDSAGRIGAIKPAWAAFREKNLPAAPAPIHAGFLGRRYSWQLVAELPLEAGSSATDGRDTWTVHGTATPPARSLAISLTHFGPKLWFGRDPEPVDFEQANHRFFLADTKRHHILPLDDWHPIRTRLATSTACPRQGLVLQLDEWPGRATPAEDDLGSLRLLVFRPRYEDSITFDWRSRGNVDLRSEIAAGGGELARDKQDLKPDDIAKWLEENPAPAPDSPAPEVARWLVEVIERTNRCSNLQSDHPLLPALAALVPHHLDLILRAHEALAMDQHSSRRALDDALATGLRRDQLPQLASHIDRHPALLTHVERRGWAADLAPQIAELARRGRTHTSIYQVAASLPDRAGLSNAELAAAFRLWPDPNLYQALRPVPGLETELDAYIDHLVANRMPLLRTAGNSWTLELAILSGHPDAPHRLHRSLSFSLNVSRYHGDWLGSQIQRHFDPADFADIQNNPEELAQWFFKQDPATFRFDPATGRFSRSATP
jgi:hypothetical protein